MWWLAALFAALLPADPSATGIKALEEQRWDAAVASFTEAIKADPKDYYAHFNLGLAQSMLGREADAIVSYRKVLELKPGLYEARLNLGILLAGGANKAEAESLLKAAAEQKPEEFRPRLYLGEVQSAEAKLPEAEANYRAALKADPKSAEATLGLARAVAHQNRLDESAPLYRKAAELKPEYRNHLLELAQLLEKANKPQDAANIYRESPENPGARERLGELLLESGQAQSAIPQLEAAVQNSPTTANQYALAIAYNTAKDYPKAEALFAKIVAAEPGNIEFLMMYGRVLREQRKFGPAAEQFFRAAQAKPDSPAAWSDLAGMLILLERYPPALAALDKVKALGAETAAHHYFRAIILDKLDAPKEALVSYEEFLRLSNGKNPDEEFKARQRVRIIKRELEKR